MSPISSFSGEFRFLSNFYMINVRFRKHAYRSGEHAYQASKMRDEEDRDLVSRCLTPGAAKRLARTLPMDPDWEEKKVRVMRMVVIRKFQQHDDLRDKLLATDPRELIEGNHWGDTFWGVCRGKGENHLGKILMAVREDFV